MSLILGLETSCDETAAAIVADGRRILANVVASQVELHREYGGVFPEMASRQHVLDIVPVVQQTLSQARADWSALDAIAVTSGPGLVGSLLVGVNMAKAIAWARGLPLIGVNHLEAHLYANWLECATDNGSKVTEPVLPLICLIVSGGHTALVLMTDYGRYLTLGQTLDDAAGEAFDKVARLLDLGYPGGPAIQAAAMRGDAERFDLPRAMLHEGYDFSFSGLKTAVLRLMKQYEGPPSAEQPEAQPLPAAALPVADIAASFQAAVVDVLVQKTRRAAHEFQVREVLLAGGVASNSLLRQRIRAAIDLPVRFPPPVYCTDNAAMVAAAGYFKHISGDYDGWDLDVQPRLRLIGQAG
jgi:N6-L-threonylcarbamoyladenine synthase